MITSRLVVERADNQEAMTAIELLGPQHRFHDRNRRIPSLRIVETR
jgi:hypothetical protein